MGAPRESRKATICHFLNYMLSCNSYIWNRVILLNSMCESSQFSFQLFMQLLCLWFTVVTAFCFLNVGFRHTCLITICVLTVC